MIKNILKILGGILGVLAALILLLALSIHLAGIGSQERLEAVTNVSIPGLNSGPEVRAYVAKPAGAGPFPVVIMIHEFFGLNAAITSMADGLSEAGYMVVAPDTFRGSTSSWIPRAIYQVSTNDPQQVNADLDSVYAWIESQPEADTARIGIAGFCYGGRVSLLYSLHNNAIAATVVFYGSSETDPEILKNLPGPVLGIFGGADASIPLEEVSALENGLKTAGIPHEITVYENQPHAFMTNMDEIRADSLKSQAWEQMLAFLETNLKNAPATRSGQSIAYQPGFDWDYYAMLIFEHAFGTASHGH
ncbi:MAG: dienelactone hydrolase family protein [Anaerolineae bacterium]|nr:dienelactone hydrolase family protein [Anaerolineae bacterium]